MSCLCPSRISSFFFSLKIWFCWHIFWTTLKLISFCGPAVDLLGGVSSFEPESFSADALPTFTLGCSGTRGSEPPLLLSSLAACYSPSSTFGFSGVCGSFISNSFFVRSLVSLSRLYSISVKMFLLTFGDRGLWAPDSSFNSSFAASASDFWFVCSPSSSFLCDERQAFSSPSEI